MISKGPSITYLARFVNGYPFKPDDLGSEGLPVVRIRQLVDEAADFEYANPPLDAVYIGNGDIVFSWSATLAVRQWHRGKALLNQHLFRVDPHPGVERRWLTYVLEVGIERLKPLMHGSAMTHITSDMLRMLTVAVPPCETQRAIADYLDAETSRIDALIEKKRRMANLLMQRLHETSLQILTEEHNLTEESQIELKSKRSGLKTVDPMKPFVALKNMLRRLPAEWQVVPICRVSRLVEEYNSDGEATMLSLTSAGTLVDRSADTQPPKDEYLLRYGLVRPGDLVVNPMWLAGGGIGVSLRYGAVSPEYRVYRFVEGIDARFIHHVVRSMPYLDQFRLLVRAETTFDRRITKDSFRDLPLPIPPMPVQRAIADDLDSLTYRTFQVTERLQRQVSLLTECRQTLIAQLVTSESIALDQR
jgi:type I restriction enzyme S subunit